MNNEEKMMNNDEIEIDLMELIQVLWKKALIILIAGILCGGIAFGASKLLITPQYDSVTKIFILSKQSENQITTSDLQAGSQMAKDYIELVKSRTVMEEVIDKLNLEMSTQELSGSITVQNPADTRILQITVRNADPDEARRIANAVRESAAYHIKKVTDIDAVNTVEVASLPTQKSYPSNGKNGVLGVLLGLILSAGFYVVKFLMDDDIKNSEDVEKYLGLNMLATLPKSEGLRDSRSKKRRK